MKYKPPSTHEIDQASATVTNQLVPHYAAVFRAFLTEEGVTRSEALALTVAYMHKQWPAEGGK